jgi:hypothetical protein
VLKKIMEVSYLVFKIIGGQDTLPSVVIPFPHSGMFDLFGHV